MNKPKAISAALQGELMNYCLQNPQYHGMFLPACNIAVSRLSQVRLVVALARREILSNLAWKAIAIPKLDSIDVLIDATVGNRHAALWVPIARDLAGSGLRVGLASNRNHLPQDIRNCPEVQDSSWFTFNTLPEVRSQNSFQNPLSLKKYRSALPWKGFFGLALALQHRYIDRLINAWGHIFSQSCVKAVITTTPYGLWSGSLVYAAKRLGISTVYIQQGTPGGDPWPLFSADVAFVWTLIGEMALRSQGWTDTRIVVAKNPTVPGANVLRSLRASQRKKLRLAENEFCVLFLGQKSRDQVFSIDGYLETCEMVCNGFKLAAQSNNLRLILRSHYSDHSHETEQFFRGHNISGFLVSQGTSLIEDIATSDVVVSMSSTALEEAYLMGRPILQVFPRDLVSRLGIDYRSIGAPLAQTSEDLASLLVDRQWMATFHNSFLCQSVAEKIRELVAF